MLIGFYGKLGSGKDTAADRLIKMWEEEYLPPYSKTTRISFAGPLKDSASAALGVGRGLLEKHKNNPDAYVGVFQEYEGLGYIPEAPPITVRNYIQRYGTEAHRDIFGDQFWVQIALPDQDYSDGLYVVTDVRMPNELGRVKELGGYVVCVLGPDGDQDGGHATEQVLDGYDFAILNEARDDNYTYLDNELTMLLRRVG